MTRSRFPANGAWPNNNGRFSVGDDGPLLAGLCLTATGATRPISDARHGNSNVRSEAHSSRAIHETTTSVTPRIRQSALRLYAGTDRPVRISKHMIGRATKLANVAYARSAFPHCREVLDEFAESQWHFYARRYVWTLAQITGDASPSELIAVKPTPRRPSAHAATGRGAAGRY
jgi:hypothetical protein